MWQTVCLKRHCLLVRVVGEDLFSRMRAGGRAMKCAGNKFKLGLYQTRFKAPPGALLLQAAPAGWHQGRPAGCCPSCCCCFSFSCCRTARVLATSARNSSTRAARSGGGGAAPPSPALLLPPPLDPLAALLAPAAASISFCARASTSSWNSLQGRAGEGEGCGA